MSKEERTIFCRKRVNFVLTILLPLLFPLAHAQIDDPYFNSRDTLSPGLDDQWALKAIGFLNPNNKKSAWSVETGQSHSVIVAVIDSGLDYLHPDIKKDNIWQNPNEKLNGLDDDGNGYVDDLLGWNFVDNDNNPWDQAGHGTHVAGIIGAHTNNGEGIAGINWGVRIMPLKIMNFVGSGDTFGLAKAVLYAVQQGAKIINLSLGVEQLSELQQRAVNFALDKDVLVIAAAGNTGTDIANVSPAGLENVLTVAATDSQSRRAKFSNWGAKIDIAAPGKNILSLRARRTDFALVVGAEDYVAGAGFVGKEQRYYRANGTSFAAPLVTGVASLLRAKYPELSAKDIKRILLQSARDIDQPGKDSSTGYGLVDAHAALTMDPEFYVDAEIQSVAVVQEKGKMRLRVAGTATADKFKQGWIEVGVGKAPQKWKKAVKNFKKPVFNGVLGDIDVKLIAGAKVWTIRLIVQHKAGKSREYHYLLTLG